MWDGASWVRRGAGNRAGGLQRGGVLICPGAEELQVPVWRARSWPVGGGAARCVWREGETRGIWSRSVYSQDRGVPYGVACSPQGTANIGRGGSGKSHRQGDTPRKEAAETRGCVSRAETRPGSIFLGLVNCYHFARIFTSFGSCLSEIHNMCSLH